MTECQTVDTKSEVKTDVINRWVINNHINTLSICAVHGPICLINIQIIPKWPSVWYKYYAHMLYKNIWFIKNSIGI
jgi:hypothetical protein